MKTVFARNSILAVIVLAVLLLAACSGPKAQVAQLPEGLASAMVPDMPLDGYLFARQSQPITVPGAFAGLPFDPAIQSVEAWLVPSDSTEAVGAVVTLAAQRDAEALLAMFPRRDDLWTQLAGSNIFLVWGSGSGADNLKKAIQARQFVSFGEADKNAWEMLQRLPGPPATKPLAVAFVRMEDRVIRFFQKNSRGNSDQGMASALQLSKVKIAAAAFYSNKPLQAADLLSPAGLKDAGIGGIVIAKSSYPGFVISAALGPAASRLNVQKTEVDGRTAYYAAAGAPNGGKVHIYFGNSGSYVYAEGSADLARTQELHRWMWGSK
ncbi:MAG: hypothetical protein HY671_13650 [Chloroflexi bacterium]|nr:hypothetical protein [Chloroflexota bacterium]